MNIQLFETGCRVEITDTVREFVEGREAMLDCLNDHLRDAAVELASSDFERRVHPEGFVGEAFPLEDYESGETLLVRIRFDASEQDLRVEEIPLGSRPVKRPVDFRLSEYQVKLPLEVLRLVRRSPLAEGCLLEALRCFEQDCLFNPGVLRSDAVELRERGESTGLRVGLTAGRAGYEVHLLP